MRRMRKIFIGIPVISCLILIFVYLVERKLALGPMRSIGFPRGLRIPISKVRRFSRTTRTGVIRFW